MFDLNQLPLVRNFCFNLNRGIMANPAKYVWLDEGLKDFAQSGVPIVTAGLQYGFSVFEGIRCYATAGGPAVFRLEEHVERLLDSALIVGFRDLPWTRDSLIEAIHKTISANKFSACYIRPVDLSGRRNEHGGGQWQAAAHHCGLGVGLPFLAPRRRNAEFAPTSRLLPACTRTS